MDTDDLSNETYEGIIMEAECLHHNLTLHFGVLAGQCDTEEEYLDAAEKLIKKIMKTKPNDFEDFLFGEVDDFSALPATLEKMLANGATATVHTHHVMANGALATVHTHHVMANGATATVHTHHVMANGALATVRHPAHPNTSKKVCR